MALDDFLVFRRKEVEHGLLDVLVEFVYDPEGVDAHAIVTGLLLDAGIVADVEPDDNRLAGSGAPHVRERDVARPRADDV